MVDCPRDPRLEVYYPRMPKPLRKRTVKEKNPAAVALGRLGGLKGGNARAAKLSAKARSEIARKAVMARWNKRKQ